MTQDRSRRGVARVLLPIAAIVAFAVLGAWFLQDTIPRRIVLASGLKDGSYHELAQRYQQILARDGVTVAERLTGGAEDNLRLLRDPASGVEAAFVHGGIAGSNPPGDVEMIAGLFYEPLWIFYRAKETLGQIDELRYKRLAIGAPGSGVRAFVEPLLLANNVTGFNSKLEPLVNLEALRALQRGEVDAAFFLGSVQAPAVWQALHDTNLELMSMARAEAYQRRFHHVRKLTLPAGTVDIALKIPAEDVTLIGTKAMLVAREDLAPAIVNLLLDAARELHAKQGYFETEDEFPDTTLVDLPVSQTADRHHRFGPSLLHRYLPFFFATYLERLVILLVPLVVILVPLFNLLPHFLRWRARSRIYRWYGQLALLERDVESHTGPLPIARWTADLDHIERAVGHIRIPASYASEAYTLREHILLVRRAVEAKAPELVPPA